MNCVEKFIGWKTTRAYQHFHILLSVHVWFVSIQIAAAVILFKKV